VAQLGTPVLVVFQRRHDASEERSVPLISFAFRKPPELNVPTPPLGITNPFVKVCTPVQLFALAKLISIVPVPVRGDGVMVSELVGEVTETGPPPPPAPARPITALGEPVTEKTMLVPVKAVSWISKQLKAPGLNCHVPAAVVVIDAAKVVGDATAFSGNATNVPAAHPGSLEASTAKVAVLSPTAVTWIFAMLQLPDLYPLGPFAPSAYGGLVPVPVAANVASSWLLYGLCAGTAADATSKMHHKTFFIAFLLIEVETV
jgi:hypothetical protein